MDETLATLFTGIDMFGFGLGRVPVWQAEKEEYPQQVSALRYPSAEQLGDVKLIDAGAPRVTELAGGFPCQDLSRAGRNAGLAGKRSVLWFEFERVIGLLQPERVYIENVPDLLRKGMCAIVEGLVGFGYSVEWDCIPAAAIGAPHLRDRLWIVAHKKPVPYIFGAAATLFPHPVQEPGSNGWMRWPRAGFTRKAGHVQELQPIAPLARAKRGSILPTPTASRFGSSGNGWQRDEAWHGRPSLDTMARKGLLPTAVASDAKGSRRATAKTPEWTSNDGTTLLDAVLQGVPTPTAAPFGHGGGGGEMQKAVKLLPTPMAADGDRSSEQGPRFYKEGTDNPTLLGAARRLPTPTVQDAHNDGGPSQMERNSLPLNAHVKVWPTPKAEPSGPDYARAKRPRSGGDDLVTAVHREQQSFPTPRASDGDKRNRGDLIAHAKERPNSHHRGERRDTGEQVAGQPNPTWVEWLMGCPLGWTDLAVPNESLVMHPWTTEPEGVPRIIENQAARVARLTALGNALVPQIPAFIASRARR